MKRTLLTALVAVTLTACGSAYGASSGPTPVPFITPPSAMPTDAVSPSATTTTSAVPPSLSPPPVAAPPSAATVPTAAPALAVLMSRTFALLPVGGSGASGTVTVAQGNGLDSAMLSIGGLPVGIVTQHTVHVHLGSCANPYAGMHLTVLGLLIGGGSGGGRLVAPIAPVYLSAGHYLIVYATSAPQRIIACANLAPL